MVGSPRPWGHDPGDGGHLRASADRRPGDDGFLSTRLVIGVVALFAVTVAATVAYMVLEDLSAVDAFYQVIITLSTVGFSEPGDGFSTTSRVITIGLILLGVGAALYFLTEATDAILTAITSGRRRRQREDSMIRAASDHVIVCGYGRVGRPMSEILAADGYDVVVVEIDEARYEEARQSGFLAVHGDAGRDEYLEQAGIMQARAIVASLPHDPGNISIVLSARARRPDAYILARGGDAESQRKLYLAGADRVVAPEAAGAERLARLVAHRDITEFVEVAVGDARLDFEVEELRVLETSAICNDTLAKSRIRDRTGALVLAVQHADGKVAAPPRAGTRMGAGDIIVALGSREQLDRLRSLTDGS
jgi:voltage-gated potassium channel